jgi:hypothetical protein
MARVYEEALILCLTLHNDGKIINILDYGSISVNVTLAGITDKPGISMT